jgi:hypothetical protein
VTNQANKSKVPTVFVCIDLEVVAEVDVACQLIILHRMDATKMVVASCSSRRHWWVRHRVCKGSITTSPVLKNQRRMQFFNTPHGTDLVRRCAHRRRAEQTLSLTAMICFLDQDRTTLMAQTVRHTLPSQFFGGCYGRSWLDAISADSLGNGAVTRKTG